MDERFLVVEKLSHHYRPLRGPRIHACEIEGLRVGEGEFVVLVGPSGCGKSTFLLLLAGLLAPSEGRITIAGHEVLGPGADRGLVFQQSSLYPWLNVAENVEFGPKMRHVTKRRRRELVERMLELVGLSEYRDQFPYELSGGMQQRVAIARVLANDPAILLMDEPFGALDALTRDRMQEELLKIWRRTQNTIVFVTHNVEEAVYLGSRVLVMSPRPGRIIYDRALPFSSTTTTDNSREVRLQGDFIAAREDVLERIYDATD